MHVELIAEDPLGELLRVKVSLAELQQVTVALPGDRREQHRAATGQVVPANDVAGPFVVFTRTEYELDFVVGGQQFDVAPFVAFDLAAGWCLQIDDSNDAVIASPNALTV